MLAFCRNSFIQRLSDVGIRQKSRDLTNSQHALRNLAKFRENFIKIGAKFDENCEKYQNFRRIFENFKNFPTKNCKLFEFGAVRRNSIPVDLEKCYKMSIYLQNLASMQPRTSLSKFGG